MLTKNIICNALHRAELCPNDVLKQCICHLLVFKPSESVTNGLWKWKLEIVVILLKQRNVSKVFKAEMQKCYGAYFIH